MSRIQTFELLDTQNVSAHNKERKKTDLKIELKQFLRHSWHMKIKIGKSVAKAAHLKKNRKNRMSRELQSKSVEKDQRSSHHWEFVIWGSSISRHFLYFHLFFNAWTISKKSLQITQINQNMKKNFPIFLNL